MITASRESPNAKMIRARNLEILNFLSQSAFGAALAVCSLRAYTYASTMGEGEAKAPFAPGLQSVANNSIPLSLLLVTLSSLLLLYLKLPRANKVGKNSLLYAYFVMISLLGILRASVAHFENLLRSAGFIIVVAYVYFVSTRTIGCRFLSRSFFYGAVIFALLNAYQAVQNSSILFWNNRFCGVTSHPNHMGVYCAVFALIALNETLLYSGKVKIFNLAVLLTYAWCVLLTGSRTALIAFVVGSAYWLYANRRIVNIKRLVVPFVLVGLCGWIFLNVTQRSGAEVRVISGTDTRSDAWASMYQVFSENMWIGAGTTVKSESSLFASFVFGGVILGTLYVMFYLWTGARVALMAISPRRIRDEEFSSQIAFCAISAAAMTASLGEGFALAAMQAFSLGIFTVLVSTAVVSRRLIS